ncbi:hypothetical protein [Micromonospora rubida]
MSPVLIKRCVVAGKAYSVADVDDPQRRALAVALLGPDGWKVATADKVVSTGPDRRRAVSLMVRSALECLASPDGAASMRQSAVTYRIDVYATADRLTDVHVVDALDGRHALEMARDALAASGADHAEVFQGDGAGGAWFYTTVKPDPVPCGRCRLMLADPGNAWCADCRADDDPAEYVAGIRVSSGL